MRGAYAKAHGIRRRAYGGASAHQRILNQATADSWTAVYDVTNPATRTLRAGSFVTTIADGLGNLPDVAQATEANQPDYAAGQFGQVDACTFDGASDVLVSSTFTTKSQPFFVMAVGKLADTSGAHYLFDVRSSTTLAALLSSGTTAWFGNAGSNISGGTPDTDSHIFEVFFNGASSTVVLDGTQIASGDIGANASDVVAIGNRADGNSTRFWGGPVGPVLYFEGTPSSTVRSNMRSLLSEVTGIAIA